MHFLSVSCTSVKQRGRGKKKEKKKKKTRLGFSPKLTGVWAQQVPAKRISSLRNGSIIIFASLQDATSTFLLVDPTEAYLEIFDIQMIQLINLTLKPKIHPEGSEHARVPRWALS